MLDERKVKLMTKFALYEETYGKEDFKISSYYKKDYRSFHTIATIIWVTVGYAVAVGIGVIAFLDELMKKEQVEVEEKAIRYIAKAADGLTVRRLTRFIFRIQKRFPWSRQRD